MSVCDALSIYAHNTMESRQAGAPMRELINKNAERFGQAPKEFFTEGPGNALRDLADSIVEDAYTRPVFSGKALQKRIIADFENEWYMACYKAGKD
ncbi:hypothetical protein ABRY95_13975 [Castellaniella ginsengisoli]|uniref:Uncharacterized protein n=1 Tax=Castellaniella ginsengisoli TaxID=546114 RepID=A0AB39DSE3_9BURK